MSKIVSMPKNPASQKLAIMARIADLYALLPPPTREEAHAFIGGILKDLPVITEVKDPQPVPMFPDPDERERVRATG